MSGMMLAFAGGSYGSAPVNTVAPVVSGTATIGQTLSTTNGTWIGAPAPTFTYQWQRSTVDISGATSATYLLVRADVGNTIRCVVKATNSIAPSGVTANSNSTAAVAALVPNAPTIGTATSTGSTTATVAYTAPADDGGATITSYTATSSPSGITGTLSQAGSGTITVSGLAGATSYTFTVTATNSAGTSAASSASSSITTLPAIGAALGGGFFAGQISTTGNSIADYNLVVGPASSAQSSTLQPKTSNSGGDPTSVINGPANSATMNSGTYPMAQFCEAVSAGGFTDWYMPAKNELAVIYFNLKPTTTTNSGYGINPNSVPAQTVNNTALNPPQTSAVNFRDSATEAFSTYYQGYYTSSQQSTTRFWKINFNYGGQYGGYKNGTGTYRVRAVRRVAV